MPNFAALRAAVFQLSTKNLRGADIRPPPVGARVKEKCSNSNSNNDFAQNRYPESPWPMFENDINFFLGQTV